MKFLQRLKRVGGRRLVIGILQPADRAASEPDDGGHEPGGDGIGTALVGRIFDVFKAIGIVKIGLLVVTDNAEGQEFWKKRGWNTRPDVVYLDYDL